MALRLGLFYDIAECIDHPILRQENVRLFDTFNILGYFRGILRLRGSLLLFFRLSHNVILKEALQPGGIAARCNHFTQAVKIFAGLGRTTDVVDLLEKLQAHSRV